MLWLAGIGKHLMIVVVFAGILLNIAVLAAKQLGMIAL